MLYVYLILSALLNGIAQIFWKIALKNENFENILRLLLNKYLLLGFLLYGISIILWFYVLSKLEVSFAYPFIAISFIIVSIGGYFMGESLNIFRIIGIGCIILGIFFISKS